MKKIVAIATAITIAIIFTFAYAMPVRAEESSDVYTLLGAVIELNFDEDVVSCLTQSGDIWEFYGISELDEEEGTTFNYAIGDVVVLTIWEPEQEIVGVDRIDHFDVEELQKYIHRACD